MNPLTPILARLMRHPFLWNLGNEMLAASVPPLSEHGQMVVLDPWRLAAKNLAGDWSLLQHLTHVHPQVSVKEISQAQAENHPWQQQDCLLVPFPALTLTHDATKVWRTLRQCFAANAGEQAPQVLMSHAVILAVLQTRDARQEWVGQAANIEPIHWMETLTQAHFQTLGMRIEEVECHYRRPANLWRDVNLYVPDHKLYTPNTRHALRAFWDSHIDAEGILALRFGLWLALVKPTTQEDQEKVVAFQKKTLAKHQ